MRIKLADHVAPYFHEDFNKLYSFEIKDGGRGSSKTSYFEYKSLVSEKGIIFNKNIAYIFMRKHHNKIRRSIYNECLKIISRLNLPKKIFKITVSPFEIKYLPTNSSIYFTGIDNIDDIKGFTSDSQEIRGVFFEEMTEIGKTLEEVEDTINHIRATFIRGTKEFSFMGAFNPPKRKKSPILEWLNKYKNRSDFNHHRSNIYMLPQNYLDMWKLHEMIQEAENLKQIDEDLWAHTYLAKEIIASGAIYKKFDEDFQRANKYINVLTD